MIVRPPRKAPHPRRRGSIPSGAGTIRSTAFGTFAAYVLVHGERRRRCFSTFEAAARWIDAESAGGLLDPLTSGQYSDAQAALALLPHNVSLLDAAREFVRAHGVGGSSHSLRLSEATEAFLAERKVSVTPRSLESYRLTLAALQRHLGEDPLLTSISSEQLESFVSSESGSTRNTIISRSSVLFSWAVRRGDLAVNPFARVPRARKVEAPLGVFTPDEAERVLRAAVKLAPECVPYLAVGFFAGIRPAELHRLTASCFSSKYIRLDGKITKIARARTIEIRPNLAAWLKAFPWRRPPVRSKTIIPGPVCKEAKVKWKSDVMRHSFATYAYEMCKDAAAVAAEMGHQGTAVFFRHYRALAEPGDGAKFFAIMPPKM